MKILIVDDSKTIVTLVSNMVKELGHEVHTAYNGQEAYELLQEKPSIEVILLDWNMPVMNGHQFLQKMSEEKVSDSFIIMMTTRNKPEDIETAMGLGAREYIMKPFTADILQSKIDLALDDDL